MEVVSYSRHTNFAMEVVSYSRHTNFVGASRSLGAKTGGMLMISLWRVAQQQ